MYSDLVRAINAAEGFSCNLTSTAEFLRNVTSTFLGEPAQLQIDGKAMVSTSTLR